MKIQRDGKILEVTKGSYKSFFKDMGWTPVEPKTEPEAPEAVDEEKPHDDENNENFDTKNVENEDSDSSVAEENDSDEFDYLLSKPVEEFTDDELRAFVAEHNIDVSNLSKKREVRKAVADYIAENKE